MSETEKRKALIPEVATKVAVAAILNPFEPEAVKSEVPEGGTIADILEGMALPRGIPALISVDGRMVLERERDFVRPRAGQFVTIQVRVEGQGQNKNAMIGIQLLALVAAAATWYAGGSGGYVVQGVGTISSLSAASVAFTATSLIGNLALRAQLPPKPNPELPRSRQVAPL